MTRPQSSAFVAILIVVAGATAARAEESVGNEQARSVQLDIPRRAGGGEGPLDWVYARLESRDDRWGGEVLNEDISARLSELIEVLDPRSGSSDVSFGAGFFEKRFAGHRVVPQTEDRVLDGPLGTAWRGRLESSGLSEPLDWKKWLGSFARLRGYLKTIDHYKVKVVDIRLNTSDEKSSRSRVLIEMDGSAPTTGVSQVRLEWELEWVKTESGLRLVAMRPLAFERAVVASPGFTDVTSLAFGGCLSFRDQLRHGVSWWRRRMDAASGMDVYGHQGLAVGDVDGDGFEDVYVSQPAGLPNRLFRNRGDGTFEDITESAGLGVLDLSGASLLLDLDGDCDLDLVVASGLEVLIFENSGRGKHGIPRYLRRQDTGFETAERSGATTLGCVAADYDGDGDLDVYVLSYIFWAGAASKRHTSYPYPYHDANNGAPNFLFRNEGSFRFSDVTAESGLDVNNRRFSLAASWCDYDDDGDPDLYVANDFGKNNLYRNEGGGEFLDVAEELGVDDTGNGMSVSWADYDNDGRFDLYVGNMWSSAGGRVAAQPAFGSAQLRPIYERMARGNSLFRNTGSRFIDATTEAGVGFGRWAWSCEFADVDADGHEDLYVLNGFITNEDHKDL